MESIPSRSFFLFQVVVVIPRCYCSSRSFSFFGSNFFRLNPLFFSFKLDHPACLLLSSNRSLLKRKEKKREDFAGSDATASMIKGGGCLGARTRQPPTAQTIIKKLMWVRGVVCRRTRTQSLTVVACVILQCIP